MTVHLTAGTDRPAVCGMPRDEAALTPSIEHTDCVACLRLEAISAHKRRGNMAESVFEIGAAFERRRIRLVTALKLIAKEQHSDTCDSSLGDYPCTCHVQTAKNALEVKP